MGKLVILKLAEGDFEQGFLITLQISNENARATVEITGKLPPNSQISKNYDRWQSIYRNLQLPSRLIGLPKHSYSTLKFRRMPTGNGGI